MLIVCNGNGRTPTKRLYESNLFTQSYEKSIRMKFCRVHTWEFKLPMIWTRLSNENKNNRFCHGGIMYQMCDRCRCHSGKLNRGNYCFKHSNLADVHTIFSFNLIHVSLRRSRSRTVRSGVTLNLAQQRVYVAILRFTSHKCWKIWLKKNTGNWPRTHKKTTRFSSTLSVSVLCGFREFFRMLNQLKCGIFELRRTKNKQSILFLCSHQPSQLMCHRWRWTMVKKTAHGK